MADDAIPDPRAQALSHLKAKRSFWAGLVVYVVVNSFMVFIWFMQRNEDPEMGFWPIWIIVGWGIGMVISAYNVFFSKPITESEIQAEMRRQQGGPTA